MVKKFTRKNRSRKRKVERKSARKFARKFGRKFGKRSSMKFGKKRTKKRVKKMVKKKRISRRVRGGVVEHLPAGPPLYLRRRPLRERLRGRPRFGSDDDTDDDDDDDDDIADELTSCRQKLHALEEQEAKRRVRLDAFSPKKGERLSSIFSAKALVKEGKSREAKESR